MLTGEASYAQLLPAQSAVCLGTEDKATEIAQMALPITGEAAMGM